MQLSVGVGELNMMFLTYDPQLFGSSYLQQHPHQALELAITSC